MHAPPPRCELGHDSWEAWSTTVVLRLTDPEKLTLARVSVEHELDAIDAACSRFRPDSELSRLNAGDGRPTPVGDLLLEALELSLHAASVTDGDVNPTVGEALKLAGYDRDWRLLDPTGVMPTADDPGDTDAPRPRPARQSGQADCRAGARSKSTAATASRNCPRGSAWTSGRPPRRGPPIAAPQRPRGPRAAGHSSASAGT